MNWHLSVARLIIHLGLPLTLPHGLSQVCASKCPAACNFDFGQKVFHKLDQSFIDPPPSPLKKIMQFATRRCDLDGCQTDFQQTF